VVETSDRSLNLQKEYLPLAPLGQTTSAAEYSGLASRVEERVGGEEKMYAANAHRDMLASR
jgi:hypothetical protein